MIIPFTQKKYSETVIPQAAAKITVKSISNAAFGAARLALEAYPYALRKENI
jgi:hypothetical protein